MYIKNLNLHGFKSFAIETNIEFNEGVTVVLGPNGIGKSNIVEAFLWVMGEQSASRLRIDSAKGLESVIFHGTDTRKPSSLAQVALTLDNKSRWIKKYDIDEVIVTRKYYRKGLSEYYINDEQVRLKDIVDMFLDTGLGKNAYSVIKQGTVSEIAKQKPEERRSIIENAAGISKYLERRREAAKKLEESERNLDNVKIEIKNAEKHYKSLKEQAARTEKYYNLKDEQKKINISLNVNQVKKLKITLEEQNKSLEEHTNKKSELEKELQDLDKQKQQELLKFEETRTLSIELDKQVSLIMTELTHIEKMSNQLKNQLDNAGKDKEETINRKNSLLKRIEEDKKQIAELEEEVKTIAENIEKSLKEQEAEETNIANEQNKIASLNDQISTLTNENQNATLKIADARERQLEVINKIITEIDEKKKDVMGNSFYQNIGKHESDIDIGFNNLLNAINIKMNTIKEFEEDGVLSNLNELSYNSLCSFIRNLGESLDTEKKDALFLQGIFKEYTKIKDPFVDLLFDKEGTYMQKEAIDKEIADLENFIKTNIEKIEEINNEIKIATDNINRGNSNLTTLTIERAKYETNKKASEDRKEMILKSMKMIEDEFASLNDKINRLEEEYKKLNEEYKENSINYKELEKKKSKTESESRHKANEIKKAESALSNFETSLAKRVKRLNEINENITRVGERINQSNDKIKDIYSHFYENYALNLKDFEENTQNLIDEESYKNKLNTINERIKNLGHINEMALDEYQEAKNRFEFLTKQKEDLEKSKEEILKIIADANKKAGEDFLKTFNEINKKFSETFKILFGGGNAGLKIQNEEDLLNSPIDIFAQPPGKRMENIVSYSGGELTMTGLALVFAIFLYRPSPFCILDEVDAALDGANIIRYKNMVKNLSDKTQFLIITHDEVSATIADAYYGITAEEKGVSKIFTVKVDKDGKVNGSEEKLVNQE
ncbi:AAA family ATPase [Brachyspira hyodysenteriae]|uniref:Chromosome partition protein Smc n=2 Tax=Brachyspira hyodysenteriae TaxID=159 RepID=A0A3B6VFE8_BRAHW|nr:AAA family ATPase [Brachyspira hyodysenteriae]ACN84361.1 chromosome partition protein SmC [Brachyspira hyodysenteriae WA1]ANN63555.1 chromosome segregation protein SMC [Brachyspira hyodysenteriae ATCC 27164]AUJ50091.1 chromosome partitioning protein Smc [Brachyspira hyodysenteriae]KLI18770.1 chromosome segregation protein SMC [Brachyspira hyodysenteriae]KLI22100.1 chromosome segregation protein SMC [Brachyspira hyodysenteriae]